MATWSNAAGQFTLKVKCHLFGAAQSLLKTRNHGRTAEFNGVPVVSTKTRIAVIDEARPPPSWFYGLVSVLDASSESRRKRASSALRLSVFGQRLLSALFGVWR